MTHSLQPHLPQPFAELDNAARILADFPHPWFVCGGWAIDLFLDRVTRPHKDVDFAIWRRDQLALQSFLTAKGWTLEKAIDGKLFPWGEGEFIPLPVHTIWCKNPEAQPDFFEILFNESEHQNFHFRRNLAIMRPLTEAVIQHASGFHLLAPEIVLLYKANNLSHEGNRLDFESALPHLDSSRRAWLRDALLITHPGHTWLNHLTP